MSSSLCAYLPCKNPVSSPFAPTKLTWVKELVQVLVRVRVRVLVLVLVVLVLVKVLMLRRVQVLMRVYSQPQGKRLILCNRVVVVVVPHRLWSQ